MKTPFSLMLLLALVAMAGCAGKEKPLVPVENYGTTEFPEDAQVTPDQESVGVVTRTTEAVKSTGEAVRKTSRETRKGTAKAVRTTREGMGEAITAPLEDINARREEIPEILEALETPYGPTGDCEAIADEIAALTVHLGPDIDDVVTETDSSGDKAGKTVGKAALGVVEDTTTGIIPFRGLVRRVTGAHAHDKKVKNAYRLGTERRAYLKGVAAAKSCS